MIKSVDWLGIANFFVFQWFLVRLAAVYEGNCKLGYTFVFAWPLTRWYYKEIFKNGFSVK